MNRNCIGSFWVSRANIDDNLGLQIYEGLVPLDVRHDFATDRFDVTAMGECFDEVERGCFPPRYLIGFERDGGDFGRGPWKRVFARAGVKEKF